MCVPRVPFGGHVKSSQRQMSSFHVYIVYYFDILISSFTFVLIPQSTINNNDNNDDNDKNKNINDHNRHKNDDNDDNNNDNNTNVNDNHISSNNNNIINCFNINIELF